MTRATQITSKQLRDYFIGWQCRIRQIAMRRDGGRPSPGMRPAVYLKGNHKLSDGITLVLIEEDPYESTEFFKFQVQKYNDPKDVYEKGLTFLQSTHFQGPEGFSDALTSVFYQDSGLAGQLLTAGECMLDYSQYGQTFKMFCNVSRLAPADPVFQATVWHNRIFNPALPEAVIVLRFTPDWSSAQADPGP